MQVECILHENLFLYLLKCHPAQKPITLNPTRIDNLIRSAIHSELIDCEKSVLSRTNPITGIVLQFNSLVLKYFT